VAKEGLVFSVKLADLEVLAKAAAEIAPHGAEAKCAAARQEVKERLFFHRVDVDGRRFAVDQKDKLSVFHFAHAADPRLAFTQLAGVGARKAQDLPRRQFFAEPRWCRHIHSFYTNCSTQVDFGVI